MPVDPEAQARSDLMILHLKQAVELGYSMATPGVSRAVREAFTDLFATPKEHEALTSRSDDLETDDHPMISRSDSGYFVQTWSWIYTESEDTDT